MEIYDITGGAMAAELSALFYMRTEALVALRRTHPNFLYARVFNAEWTAIWR